MAAPANPAPYCWLVQIAERQLSSGGSKWSPLRSQDSIRLENALASKQAGLIPVDSGRYDVDLSRRVMRATYWEEEERRVLRSLWFHDDQNPYEEEDSDVLEAVFNQVQNGKVALPFRVPVNQGCHNVCFDISKADGVEESSSVLSYLPSRLSWGPQQTSAEVGTTSPDAQTGPDPAPAPEGSMTGSTSAPTKLDTASSKADGVDGSSSVLSYLPSSFSWGPHQTSEEVGTTSPDAQTGSAIAPAPEGSVTGSTSAPPKLDTASSKADGVEGSSSVLSYLPSGFSWGPKQTSAEVGTTSPDAQTDSDPAPAPEGSMTGSTSAPPKLDTASFNEAVLERAALQKYTFVQECISRIPGQAPAETWQVWRGSTLPPSEDEAEESGLPARVDCLVFVAHGASRCHDIRADPSGFRDDVADLQREFHDDVARLRHLSCSYLQQSSKEGAIVRGRVEFVPIDWWELIHVEVGIVKRIQKVVSSPSGLRNLLNVALADTMIYQQEDWRERAAKTMFDKMQRLHALFTSRTPEYSGKIALIGHSLGSVLMFDVLRRGNFTFSSGFLVDNSIEPNAGQIEDESSPAQLPVPCCIFTAGAPLGMFLSMMESPAQIQKGFRGMSTCWPPSSVDGSWHLFNILHPGDLFAYRLEPLLNSEYSSVLPKAILSKGHFLHKVGEWWGSVGSVWSVPSPSRTHVGKDNSAADVSRREDMLELEAVGIRSTQFFGGASKATQASYFTDRVDYVLQETMFESISEVQNATESHACYFAHEDFARFIIERILLTIHSPPAAPQHLITSPTAAQAASSHWQRKPTLTTKMRTSQIDGLRAMQQASAEEQPRQKEESASQPGEEEVEL